MTVHHVHSSRFVAVVALWIALLAATPAGAQITSKRMAAESLFAEGRESMLAGKYEAACQKFDASRKLEPALGTTLNLAACYEKLGRTASAWAEFKTAAAEARRVGDAERHATALARAAALEPKLSRLRVSVQDPAITVSHNGELLSAALLTSAIPVDPGRHRLEARAPGKQPWVKVVEVGSGGAPAVVRIPRLVELVPEPDVDRGSGASQRAVAWASGTVGVAGAATGIVFGLLAASNWATAKDGCQDYPFACTLDAKSKADRAKAQANIATVATITGGVGLGLSALLFLTDPGETVSAELVVGPTHLLARGTF
jgi:hypothetical protein